MSSIPENTLRDLLAGQLDLVEDGLTLLNIEKYIPNELGTRGFIDILAKDSRDRWVLIELKRSDAAAREAVHEVYKYVEGVKAHLRVREDEIRTLIISTEWRELLVPFSRFIEDSSFSVLGLQLLVDEDNAKLLGIEQVEPLPIQDGRILSPWHEIYLYESQERLEQGLESCDFACNQKGINDYLMLELEAPEGFYEASIEATAQYMWSIVGDGSEISEGYIADTASKMPRRDHMIYFVPLLLPEDAYREIVERNPKQFSEVIEYTEGLEGDELLETYQSGILNAKPSTKNDYFEIAYPAKFRCKLIESEGWRIERIHRHGAFARNTVLTDDTILSEISGDTGTTGQRLKRSISLSEKSEISQLKKDVAECLLNNPVWKSSVEDQIAEAAADFPEGELDVSIFTPTTGLMTLFFAMREDGVLFVPTYSLVISDRGEAQRAYFGEITSEGERMIDANSFNGVIEKYYDGDLGMLLLTMSWGGYESRDLDILEDLGIIYSSFRCDVAGQDREFFRMRNAKWRQVDEIRPFQGFQEYANRNAEIFQTIDAKLSPRLNGAMWDGSSAERQLETLVDERTLALGQLHLDVPERCDLCRMPLKDETFISDARISGLTAWGNMCADCTVYHGDNIGWGSGQLYRNEGDGQWLMVAGAQTQNSEYPEDL